MTEEIKSLSDRWVHDRRRAIENPSDPPVNPLSSVELERLYHWVHEFMKNFKDKTDDMYFPRGSAISALAKWLELPDEGAGCGEFLIRFDLIHSAYYFVECGCEELELDMQVSE